MWVHKCKLVRTASCVSQVLVGMLISECESLSDKVIVHVCMYVRMYVCIKIPGICMHGGDEGLLCMYYGNTNSVHTATVVDAACACLAKPLYIRLYDSAEEILCSG